MDFFQQLQLKDLLCNAGFPDGKCKKADFVLFVRSLITVLAIIESLLFIHVTSDWVSLKTK